MSIVALEDTICLALGREVLTRLLGDKVEVIIYRNLTKWAMEKTEGLKELTISQLERILDSIEIVRVKKGITVINKGVGICENLYIVL